MLGCDVYCVEGGDGLCCCLCEVGEDGCPVTCVGYFVGGEDAVVDAEVPAHDLYN